MNQATAPVHICLLGAPGTGKTQLAAELAAALSAEKHAASVFTVNDNPALRHLDPSACTTLLMGLDLPAPPASAELQQAADRALRDVLAQSGVSYQVVYGQGEQRLRSALSALQAQLPGGRDSEVDAKHTRWVWACDNCSDPQCERRLLSDLLAARVGSAGST
ncbi:MAG: AAA family ATPase [Pseudomonadota bacterium]